MLFEQLEIPFTSIGWDPGEHTPEPAAAPRPPTPPAPAEAVEKVSDILDGQNVVFTGVLHRFDRRAAQRIVTQHGGTAQRGGVTRETTILVVGKPNAIQRHRDDPISDKERAARAINAAGGRIAIISEQKFSRLLGLGADPERVLAVRARVRRSPAPV